MDDPFFKAQKSPAGWGRHKSYLEDLSRTYKTALGPQLSNRESETYKRALAFREREKAHYARLEGDYKSLHNEHSALERDFDELSSQLSKIMEAYKTNAVPTRTHSNRVDASAPSEPAQLSEPSKDLGGELPGAVLSTDSVSDTRGPSGEDDAQGRQTGGDDTAGSVQESKEPVHEGGD
jgi:hypothetical protein